MINEDGARHTEPNLILRPPRPRLPREKRRWFFKFPPTYRAFLKIHNGWRGFPIDFAMFGVSGAGYLRPAKELASYLKVFERTFRRQGRTHVEDLKRKEKSDQNVIYMPHHPSIATDFNGVFTVSTATDLGRERI